MLRFLLTLTAVVVVAIIAIAYVAETVRDKVRPATVATVAPFDFMRLT